MEPRMQPLRELYRIGRGPSSSHTMGPAAAAARFQARYPSAHSFSVHLYGSLAATGKGHLTDQVLHEVFAPKQVHVQFHMHQALPLHANGMEMQAHLPDGSESPLWRVYSVGGGAIREEGGKSAGEGIYPVVTMEGILQWAESNGRTLWEYVFDHEGDGITDFLQNIWSVMQQSIRRGLENEGSLPGSLHLMRKSPSYYAKGRNLQGPLQKLALLFAYALGVAEENAAGGEIVTAPTCGSCGVLPAVLRYMHEIHHVLDIHILRALATAGLVGNLIKTNASISGAEVGCQGEIGTACAMAAAASAQLMGGTPRQIEYAAEMGLEHHLGLTCDPVDGLVQIPCIERNAMAAARAIDGATYALMSDGRHRISFDSVVSTMAETGRDLNPRYRETANGGLANRTRKKK